MKVTAFAPATVANVSCGFDIFGFALEQPGDLVTLETKETPGIVVRSISGDGGKLSKDADKNSASVAVMALLTDYQKKNPNKTISGYYLDLEKKLPLGSGMGSSAASSAAAVIAINQMLGNPYSKEELVPFAMEGEFIACGARHADNVAPSIMGEFVLVRSYEPLDLLRVSLPEELYSVVIHPDCIVNTRDAREVVPQTFSRADLLKQTGNASALILGLLRSDPEIIRRSLCDVVAEPYRKKLIPHYDEAVAAALSEGALGCGISGSGPSLFALCWSKDRCKKVAKKMVAVFESHQMKAESFISCLSNTGAKVIKKSIKEPK